MRLRIYGPIVGVLLVLAASAHGTSLQDRIDCIKGRGDQQVAGCTGIIDDRSESAQHPRQYLEQSR